MQGDMSSAEALRNLATIKESRPEEVSLSVGARRDRRHTLDLLQNKELMRLAMSELRVENMSFSAVDQPIFEDELFTETLFLPAIAIASALRWTTALQVSPDIGGFHIHLTADPNALLEYRVSKIETSTPSAWIMAVHGTIASQIKESNNCAIDKLLAEYAEWMLTEGAVSL